MCVLKIVLIFINILPCKPPLNLLFLIVWLWSSCYYPFLKKFFFSPHFLADIVRVADIVRAQNFSFLYSLT